MDSKNNFLKSFIIFIEACSDEVLIQASNKGIVKRSHKDMDNNLNIEVNIEEDRICTKINSEEECILKDNIHDSTCSCPSKTICKHIITSFIYIRENRAELLNIEENGLLKEQCNNININFDNILDYDMNKLVKSIGINKLKEIIFRVEYGVCPTIKEENILTISIDDIHEEVRFYHNLSADQGLCNCKSKELCIHKAEAIIHYKIKKNTLNIDSLKSHINLKIDYELIKEIEALLREILEMGLSKISSDILEKIESYAILCGSKDMPSMEKRLRSLKSFLEEFFNKQVGFNINEFRKYISRIYISCESLLNSKDINLKNSIIGENKTSYFEIPTLKLYGLGMNPWISTSGYEGNTFYFYCESNGQWYTYTAMIPTYYDSHRKNNISAQDSIWNDINIEEASKSQIVLYRCKINRNNRISSSKETTCNIIGDTKINELDFKDKMYDDWNEVYKCIQNNYSYLGIDGAENRNLFMLKIKSYDKSIYNEKLQILTMKIYDINNNEIFIKINYKNDIENKIKTLEKLEKMDQLPIRILGKVYKEEGKFMVNIIFGYNEEGHGII